jgi:hypothetical protein
MGRLRQSTEAIQRILDESDGLREFTERELNTLKGEGEGSIKQALNEVLGGASEAYDTLKEIEEYIEKDEAGAVALTQSITRLETEKVSKEDIDSALSTESENPVMNKVITEELGKKASIDGTYPDLTAGDLAGRGESVPAEFGFRASGGKSIKDGRAYIKRIKGNSVVWNNMVDTRGYEGQLFISTGIRIVKGHKYLLYRTETNQSLYLIPTVNGADNYDMVIREGQHSGIFQAQYSDDKGQGTVYSENYCGACVISDLTKMFGEGNEPTKLEECEARKPIVEDEYAYNEGQVIHSNTESIKSVGDNAWDERWEQGAIESDGSINSEAYRRTTSYTRVLPNEEYFLACPESAGFGRYAYYDANYTPIKVEITEGYPANKKFTTPSGASYLRITLGSGYGTTYNHDILISLFHSGWKAQKDDQYQPYWQDILPLPIIRKYFPDGMKKAGSAHDEIRFNKASGKWEYSKGRIKSVDMGDLEWGYYPAADSYPFGFFYASLQGRKYGDKNILCGKYAFGDFANDKSILGNSSGETIYIMDSSYTDAATFKASLQGVMLYYESKDWEWAKLDAEDQNFRDYYNVADFGTEQAISTTPSAPFSADIIYQFNAVDMIREHELEITELQNIITEQQSAIATMQAQLTSLINGGQ